MKAFCIGCGKTGTMSINSMFRNYVSRHEPEAKMIIENVIAGKPMMPVLDYIYDKIDMDMNSSSLNYFMLDEILEKFPDSKFILTTRNTNAWLRSFYHWWDIIDSEQWNKFREYRFGKGKPSLDTLLKYWKKRHEDVIKKVPADRLLIVNTKDLSNSCKVIADFLGINENTLVSSHTNKTPDKDVRAEQNYPQDKIDEYCTSDRWGK